MSDLEGSLQEKKAMLLNKISKMTPNKLNERVN
jgi:hypothetical protein